MNRYLCFDIFTGEFGDDRGSPDLTNFHFSHLHVRANVPKFLIEGGILGLYVHNGIN